MSEMRYVQNWLLLLEHPNSFLTAT
jgi:hypothetical protein